MTLKNLLVCAFAATMSFMTTNAFAADDEWQVIMTPFEDELGTEITWNKETEFGPFKGIEVGDKVRMTMDVIDANPQIQAVVKIGAGWDWTEFLSEEGYVDIPANGILEFDIKNYPDSKNPVTGAELADAFQTRTLICKGQAVSVTKVEVLRKASAIKEYETVGSYDITDGDFNGWKNIITIPASKFADLAEGDFIDIYVEGTGAQLQFAVKVGPDQEWTQLMDYGDVVDYYTIAVEGTITNPQDDNVSLSAADFITAVKAHGLFLKGQGNATKVVIRRLKGGETGIGSINADNNIDENKPVEIYSLDGRKMQNTNVHGIYILRQGNKTIKVMK